MVDVVPKTPPELLAFANVSEIQRHVDPIMVYDVDTAQMKQILSGHFLDYRSRQAVGGSYSGNQVNHQNNLVVNGVSNVEYTLWAATVGSRIGFNRFNPATTFRIIPQSGNYIGWGGNGEYVELLSSGDFVLVCRIINYWDIERASCTYRFQNTVTVASDLVPGEW